MSACAGGAPSAPTGPAPDAPVAPVAVAPLQPHLVTVVNTRAVDPATADQLLDQLRGPSWRWLRTALHAAVVRHLQATDDTGEDHQLALARALETHAQTRIRG